VRLLSDVRPKTKVPFEILIEYDRTFVRRWCTPRKTYTENALTRQTNIVRSRGHYVFFRFPFFNFVPAAKIIFNRCRRVVLSPHKRYRSASNHKINGRNSWRNWRPKILGGRVETVLRWEPVFGWLLRVSGVVGRVLSSFPIRPTVCVKALLEWCLWRVRRDAF